MTSEGKSKEVKQELAETVLRVYGKGLGDGYGNGIRFLTNVKAGRSWVDIEIFDILGEKTALLKCDCSLSRDVPKGFGWIREAPRKATDASGEYYEYKLA